MTKIFPYANTVVCIEDSRMLRQFQYDILHNSPSLEATLDELNKINYFQSYEKADSDNFRTLLDGLMINTFDLIRNTAPTELVWRMFALYYDIHNMKLVAKERLLGKWLDRLSLLYGSYSLPTIRSAAVRETDDILGNETLTEGFFQALRAPMMRNIDFILDKVYYQALKEFAIQSDIPEIVGFVTEKADLFNISAYYQSLHAGSPTGYFSAAFTDQGSRSFGEWQSFIEGEPDGIENFVVWQNFVTVLDETDSRADLIKNLDVHIDNYLIGRTKVCKLMAFGLEPIYAYFFNKFMEIKNIRILLAGKKFNYKASEIKRRMRIPYEL